MGVCEHCLGGTSLPYSCNYCGMKVCRDHRLPENHNCPELRNADTLGPDFRPVDAPAPSNLEPRDPHPIWNLLIPIILVYWVLRWLLFDSTGRFVLLFILLVTAGLWGATNMPAQAAI